jgi:hypothetical protein
MLDDDFESFERMVHEHWPTNISKLADLQKLHGMVSKIHEFITESISGEDDCSIVESMILMKWMQIVGQMNYDRSNVLLMGMLCDERIDDIKSATMGVSSNDPAELHVDELSVNFPDDLMEKIMQGVSDESKDEDFATMMANLIQNTDFNQVLEEMAEAMSNFNTEEE